MIKCITFKQRMTLLKSGPFRAPGLCSRRGASAKGSPRAPSGARTPRDPSGPLGAPQAGGPLGGAQGWKNDPRWSPPWGAPRCEKNDFLNLAHPGGAVGVPKPCFPTTYSIDQIEQFKESYSTFEFRALSLRPEGIPLWQSRCADAGPSLLQKGFPPGAFCTNVRMLLPTARLGPPRAVGRLGNPSGPLGGTRPSAQGRGSGSRSGDQKNVG